VSQQRHGSKRAAVLLTTLVALLVAREPLGVPRRAESALPPSWTLPITDYPAGPILVTSGSGSNHVMDRFFGVWHAVSYADMGRGSDGWLQVGRHIFGAVGEARLVMRLDAPPSLYYRCGAKGEGGGGQNGSATTWCAA